FEFTNLVCNNLDKKFGEFEYCHIKSVNRSYKYVSGKLKLYKLPLTKLMINVALFKRSNGYKPFLYNITFDTCALLRKSTFNPIGQLLHDTQTEYTNLNQSCPITHDIILEKVPIDYVDKRFSKILPFPEGDYLAKIYWLNSEHRAALAEIYGSLT
ncbi:hypothetical protein KR032_002458, partial [Drosophila birchii]